MVSEQDQFEADLPAAADADTTQQVAAQEVVVQEVVVQEVVVQPRAGAETDLGSDQSADLDRIAKLPLAEQPAAFERIHADLQRALAEIDQA